MAVLSLFPCTDLVPSASAAEPETKTTLKIADHHLVLGLDRTVASAEVASSQTQQVGSGSSKKKQILLGIAVAAGLAAATVRGLKKAKRWPEGTPGV